jgi:hypothetical protein
MAKVFLMFFQTLLLLGGGAFALLIVLLTVHAILRMFGVPYDVATALTAMAAVLLLISALVTASWLDIERNFS